MEARVKHSKPRTREITAPPAPLDAMAARGSAEVIGVLRGAASQRDGRLPTAMWKTGWPAQPEGAA